MAATKKSFGVHKGCSAGAYETWAECGQQTDNFCGTVFKESGVEECAKTEFFVIHDEIPASTSNYYGVAGGPEPGVYSGWAKVQPAIHGHSSARYESFDTLVEAKAWLIDQGADASTSKISQSHFAQYPEFEPESNKPFDEEFKRLAQSQDWIPNSQQYHEQRTLAIKEEIQNEYWEPALKEEELSQLTQEERKLKEDEWKIHGYQTLLREVNAEPRDTIAECVEALQNTLVNIVDLLDARRTGVKAEIFKCFQDFRRHTMKPGKRIHLDTAKKDEFLSTLLQKLRSPKNPRRRRAPLHTLPPNVACKPRGSSKKTKTHNMSQVHNARVSKASQKG
jgi:viroplasmin and RNaseH domain-containing protein